MEGAKQFLDAIEVLIQKAINDNTTQIYGCVCKAVYADSKCSIVANGKNNTVKYYGNSPVVGKSYRVFVPNGNMSMAFIITGGEGSSPTPTPGVTDYNALENLPSINNVTLSGNKSSEQLNLYGNNNPPPYPVKSVNGKTETVILNANDVGALPNTTVIPTKTSQLTNDSNFATTTQVNAKYTKPATGIPKTDFSSGVQASLDKADSALQSAPVTSVNSKTGKVVLTQDDIGDGSTYVRTHNDFTDAVKAQINTNEDNIAMLDSDIENLQTKTNTLETNVNKVSTALTSKQDTIVGGASTITDDNLSANRVLISNSSGKVEASTVTSAELGRLSGATSNVQTQIDGKVSKAGDTMTGALTVNGNITGNYLIGSWLQTTANTALGSTPSKIAVIDNGWIYSRTPAQIKSDIGLSNVDNVKQYSSTNPPPYPVTSVNGQTGDVTVSAGGAGVNIVLQATKPTGQSTGDFWYKIL